jgi:KipI family sensor histidine kinase inhibitor
MRILPSGTTAFLVELGDLDEVLGLYAALIDEVPAGVVDIVPAARTLLVVTDPRMATVSSVAEAVRRTTPRPGDTGSSELVEIPVRYDGEDLHEAAEALGCDGAELVRRHTAAEWTVAFTGFAPGFGYLRSKTWQTAVPRRSSPRTKVPRGAVALAGEFSGIYPRESPGGWQLIGHTSLAVFDLGRQPPALLRPGTGVRFLPESAS